MKRIHSNAMMQACMDTSQKWPSLESTKEDASMLIDGRAQTVPSSEYEGITPANSPSDMQCPRRSTPSWLNTGTLGSFFHAWLLLWLKRIDRLSRWPVEQHLYTLRPDRYRSKPGTGCPRLPQFEQCGPQLLCRPRSMEAQLQAQLQWALSPAVQASSWCT